MYACSTLLATNAKTPQSHAHGPGIRFQIIGRGLSVETRPVLSTSHIILTHYTYIHLNIYAYTQICVYIDIYIYMYTLYIYIYIAYWSCGAAPLRLWTALKVFSAGRRHLRLGTCSVRDPQKIDPVFPNRNPPKLPEARYSVRAMQVD